MGYIQPGAYIFIGNVSMMFSFYYDRFSSGSGDIIPCNL